jgi:hypothetical protein
MLEAARWRQVTDTEFISLDAHDMARIIAHWETAMQLQAVLRKRGKG